MKAKSNPPPETPPEPSVLDYIKSKLTFGRYGKIEIPPLETEAVEEIVSRPPSAPVAWISLGALGLAIFGQVLFEPPNPSVVGLGFYAAALGLLIWAVLRRQWILDPPPEPSTGVDPLTFRRPAFLLSIPVAALAFFLFSGNLFTGLNLTVWFIAIGLYIGSLWVPDAARPPLFQRLRDFLSRRSWQLVINRWTVLLLVASLVVIFFRVYHLAQTPAEPFSDHAEKLLDVYDVSQGQTHIFFPRNTGREAIQMYWTLLMSWIFGTGISFISLKIGTVLFGLFTLPYMYLLGKEIANARVGLLAFFLAGVGYWPNVISRIGLRFPLYPLFVAPLLLYLIRGLRTRNRNDFILAGIFLGLGLHGYTPYRIVPFLVIIAFLLYVLHAQSRGVRQDALLWLVIVGLMSMLIFLPLLRYATQNPEMFAFRALTRIEPVEQPLSGPWYQVLLSNTWNAFKMFNWDNGTIWVNSIPDRPALDVVTAALFVIGLVLVLVRYVQRRHWLDLFLLVSIPVLLLPSILSLAYPGENPALNRTAGAIVPVFLIAALALDGLMAAFERSFPGAGQGSPAGASRSRAAWGYLLAVILLFCSASQNFDLALNQFDQNFRNNAWNSSEMGAVIKQFGLTFGETDTVWIVPFPFWVDTRLPGMWAGIPDRDFAMFPEHLGDTLKISGPKLFIVKASLQDPSQNDQKSLDLIEGLYPQGFLTLHHSPVPGRDFWMYTVPAPSSP